MKHNNEKIMFWRVFEESKYDIIYILSIFMLPDYQGLTITIALFLLGQDAEVTTATGVAQVGALTPLN